MAVHSVGWMTLAANQSGTWYVHDFSEDDVAFFSIVVIPGSGPGVINPLAHATITQGEKFQHNNGTQAYLVHLQNNAPFNSCQVQLLYQVESL